MRHLTVTACVLLLAPIAPETEAVDAILGGVFLLTSD